MSCNKDDIKTWHESVPGSGVQAEVDLSPPDGGETRFSELMACAVKDQDHKPSARTTTRRRRPLGRPPIDVSGL